MKKIFVFFMTVLLVVALAACKTGEDSSTGAVTSGTDTAEFKEPENYATVLLVTINPEFKLYLDAQGSVVAVEPVNSDADSLAAELENMKGDLETVVHDIVAAADKGGFVKDNATVDFRVVIVKDNTVNTDEILNIAKTTALQVFDESEKTIEVNVSVAEDAFRGTDSSDAGSSDADTSDADSSNEEASSTDTAVSTEPQDTEPQTHEHVYAPATCTEPMKCDCGATTGEALGHDYANGICTVCGAEDPDYVPCTPLQNKAGSWELKFLSGKTLYRITLKLYSSSGNGISAGYDVGDLLDDMSDDLREHFLNNCADSIITFEGKQYFFGRGSGDEIAPLKEDGTTVTITDTRGAKLVLTRTAENTMTVQSCDASFAYIDEGVLIPAGAVFTFVAE